MNIVFVSGTSWHIFEQNGFRTRQGALLRQFSCMSRLGRLVVVTATGFHGQSGFEKIVSSDAIPLTQVYLPGRLPESMVRPLGHWALEHNYLLPAGNWLPKEDTLIWSYCAGLGKKLKRFTGASLFYDVVDYRPNDTNLTAAQRHLWRMELADACHKADVVVTNGETAFKQVQPKVKRRCELVRNGVDVERFIPCRDNNARDGIGFVGVISSWIDFDLLKKLVSEMPNIAFKFYGIIHGGEDRINVFRQYPNFHWNGQLPPENVPAFLSGCKVGIVPYDSEITKHTLGDSMKIFECLAAGTPVVCTNFQHHLREKFPDLIEVCENHDQFVSTLCRLVEQKPDPNWQERAWQFTMANTWQKRVEQILDIAGGYHD